MLYHIDKKDEGKSIAHLVRRVLKVSASAFSSMKFSGSILVNGTPVHARYTVKDGDVLELIFPNKGGALPFPSPIPLDIVFEDEYLLVINKPAPLPSVRSRGNEETLENRVYFYMREPEDFVFHPVNRLDKGTSGLMVAAKDTHTQQLMQKLLNTGNFVREYLAIVEGILPKEGRVDQAIGKVGAIKRAVMEHGKPASTAFWRLKSSGQRSLVRLRLFTGRTHQIRVHLSSIGHPVVGDFLYGKEDPQLPGRFALHAESIRFKHPLTQQNIHLSAPLPDELEKILNFWPDAKFPFPHPLYR